MTQIITRRNLLRSMLAAPLVVPAAHLMSLRGTKMILPSNIWVDGVELRPGDTLVVLPSRKFPGKIYTITNNNNSLIVGC